MREPILTARDVHKTYRLGRVRVPVLRGVSLTIDPGEWVAVLGASGSGKSTLMHLLGGLDRPDATPASTIEYRGKTLASMGARGLDRYRTCEVGFVFQFYHLLPELTVLDNVLVPAMVRAGRFGYMRQRRVLRQRAGELLDKLGLAHRTRHRPVELSGGERQRVAIARALINEPAVLLADEPTGNLDATTGGAILEVLTELCRAAGLTMVMVTHDARVAARADRIETLSDGRMESAGEPDAADGWPGGIADAGRQPAVRGSLDGA